MATTDVPLQPFTRAQDVTAVRDELDSFGDNNGFALPPTDTGIRAWAFLLGCFLLEGLIWGQSSIREYGHVKNVIALQPICPITSVTHDLADGQAPANVY